MGETKTSKPKSLFAFRQSTFKRRGGFTLIEITIAVVILASALVILLGLQTSAIDRTIRDQNSQQAMLVSRRILSAVEAKKDELDVGEIAGNIEEVLNQLNAQDGEDVAEREALLNIENYQVRLEIELSSLPELDEQMKRILLTLSWGDPPFESLQESYQVVYFTPHTLPQPVPTP